MSFSQKAMALTLAAATIFGQTSKASATTMQEYLRMDKDAKYELYRKVVQARMDQLRARDPAAADKLTDFYLKAPASGQDAPGYHEFKVNIDAIEHPEISGSKFDPQTTQVEGLLSQIILNDFHDLKGAQVTTASARAPAPPSN